MKTEFAIGWGVGRYKTRRRMKNVCITKQFKILGIHNGNLSGCAVAMHGKLAVAVRLNIKDHFVAVQKERGY